MKALLEKSINWNSIENPPKDNYLYHVEKAAISKKANSFTLEVATNFIIPTEDLARIEMMLHYEFPEIERVDLRCAFREQLPPEAKILRKVEKKKTEKLETFFGKRISETPIKISEAFSAEGAVVLEGEIFQIETRQFKNDKQLATLLITDHIDSACVKWFTTREKWEKAEQVFRVGTYLKVRGSFEFDQFELASVLKAKDLEQTEKPKRVDPSSRKRVELHAHTKMSKMDGLSDIYELVATAASWGHKAIAVTDHGIVQAFPEVAKYIAQKKLPIKPIYGMEGYLVNDDDKEPGAKFDHKSKATNHIILLVENQTGLRNLYELVSLSHTKYHYKRPRIPKSVLAAYREGIIIGSACEAGEVFQAVMKKQSEEKIAEIVAFYDYLEIQPTINNRFLIENGTVENVEALQDLNRKIIELGERYEKPVVATCDSHYTNQRDSIYRKILMAGMGYKDAENGDGLYFRTTEEMLAEFSYLGEEMAERVVIDNPEAIAERVEFVRPVPEGRFPPQIEKSEEKLRKKCVETAKAIYGDPLPELIDKRLEKELCSIINNGYAVMYVSAELLVEKSLSDGYLVGSRGSVGSSFAATMAGITEVNPLPPHYICENPECKHSEFPENSGCDCGVDLPDKNCPICGNAYKKDGFSIPFEVFLGFEGDKEPDIDLNFAGEYQAVAHKFLEEIFGPKNIYRAGTIGTVASKTAYGFVKNYFNEKGVEASKWEVERLTLGCTGVKRTTGQHPGGIIIVPDGHDICEFCPVQYPADDEKKGIVTTHFEYHSIDTNLLKLDILGHDAPSIIRMLQDMTGLDPLAIPMRDPLVNSLFNGVEGLAIKVKDYPFTHGSFGVPEFGTKFVRQMLDDIKPKHFSDLVRISGFSHGTNVWLNNAQEFIRNGSATIDDAIATRDDIMNYLIAKGVPAKTAFKIMENVRKGKGVKEEEAEVMKQNDVPDWYTESCRRISYMFPKAHAVAYVMMSYRIAYYKVYYPQAFYATFFSKKVSDFNQEVILQGMKAIKKRMEELEGKGKNALAKEEDEVTVLEVAYEMHARGFEFLPVDLFESDAADFLLKDDKVLLPLCAIAGVGENAAKKIVEERVKGPFLSMDDLAARSKINKTALEALAKAGVLTGLPESNQLTLF
ncbi:MAG: PolC-type DNA polymerase III [Eubacteriales bacterium]|nr:PolC-type DNA polymerase III [Eubacteriales bacterium]MDD3349945.1 PolC-type DNA polymerase III [Eubacteriales bacterium]